MAVALFSGCASSEPRLVLDQVGPPSLQPDSAGSKGSLLVFSEISIDMPSSIRPDHTRYTDYKILSEQGELLQTVHNEYDVLWEGPKEVKLPPGTYRVLASAYRYGLVTVPVVIVARQTTVVHLDGGDLGPERAALIHSNPVRLPNGQIVGWRSTRDQMAKP